MSLLFGQAVRGTSAGGRVLEVRLIAHGVQYCKGGNVPMDLNFTTFMVGPILQT